MKICGFVVHTGAETVAFDGKFVIGNFPGIFKSRMKRINSSYILIEFLSGRRSGAYTDTTVEFRFGTIVLIENLVFNVAYEKIGVAGSYFGAHGHAVDLFIITVRE